MALAIVVLVAAGCSSDTKKSLPTTTPPTTTTLPSPASRAQVKDMVVFSLPESPALNKSIIRAHWAEIVARLPEHLPALIPQTLCETGPVLIVRLRNGSEIDYQCKQPPAIKAVRDYMVSVVVNTSKSTAPSTPN
ncbi:MAG: hypothetical protein QOG50_2771 [Actinomycetota bacterium]|nr:hypothetical protein [Actinomycetota bacterium]